MLITLNQYPKILLKIDSATAPGLHISIDLLDGLLELLKSRGYAKERVELLFFEVDEVKRSEGFNAITENGFYKGYRVRSPNDYDFYESNCSVIVRCLQRCTIEQNFIYDFQTTVKSV